MNIVVIDASYAGAWMLPDELSDSAEELLREILMENRQMAVPELWHYEMCNLLRSTMRRKRIEEVDASVALDLLQHVPRQIFDHRDDLFQRRLMTIAMRFELSAYDAAYLELADRLQCPLYSNDRRLREAARTLGLIA